MNLVNLMTVNIGRQWDNLEQGDVISFLTEIRNAIARADPPFITCDLKKVLRHVENGEYEFSNANGTYKGVLNSVNLAMARRIITDYIEKSEGGCNSCQHCMSAEREGSKIRYCLFFQETPESVPAEGASLDINFGKSSNVARHYRDGCEGRAPRMKTIEQILGIT